MDIRDFQEGVSYSRFNTRRLPTEEELRAQAEAELKKLVLNAIDQVFTRESDTHFDDFALALSAAGITLGATPPATSPSRTARSPFPVPRSDTRCRRSWPCPSAPTA